MDPVTALAIQGGLAGAQALYGGYQQRRAKQGLAMLEDPLATTPAARLQMLNASRDQTVANQALNEINRSLGTSVNALQSGGARAAGAISGVQRAADAAKLNVLARQEQRQDAAMSQFAQAGERDRFMRNQRAMQNERNLQRAQQAGVQNIANAAISLGTGLAQTDFSGRKQENPPGPTTRTKLSDKNLPGLQNISQPEAGGLSETMIQRTPENVFDAQARIREQRNEKLGSSFDMGAQSGAVKRRLMPFQIKDLIDTDPSILGDENFPEYTNRPDGIYLNPEGGDGFPEMEGLTEIFEEETFKKGGKKYKAKKTPGKFSHKTNPLHIVSNNGAKVGEMTGGEYIFNPKQAASLRKHSKSGSSPLHKFVRQMLSKSQFK